MKRELTASEKQKKKARRRNALLAAGGLLLTGAIAWFGRDYFFGKSNKEQQISSDSSQGEKPDFDKLKSDLLKQAKPRPQAKVQTTKTQTETKTQASSAKKEASDIFPLQRGSKGEKVSILKKALAKKFGKNGLEKSLLNDNFDLAFQVFLIKNQIPTLINESAYLVLTEEKKQDPVKLAHDLNKAANNRLFYTVLTLIKSMRNTKMYAEVNKTFRMIPTQGFRQSIVNALLNTFKEEKQKQALRLAFSEIGLKYDGKKWSLEGIEQEILLITTDVTTVWKNAKQSVQVAANTVLGKEISKRVGFTLFENEGNYYLVPCNKVTYYQSV